MGILIFDALGGVDVIKAWGLYSGPAPRMQFATGLVPRIQTDALGSISLTIEIQGTRRSPLKVPSKFLPKEAIPLGTRQINTTDVIELPHLYVDQAIRNMFGSVIGDSGFRWRIACKFKSVDGEIDTKYYPTNGRFYEIPCASDNIETYNQFDNSNVPGSTAGYIKDKIRIIQYVDDSANDSVEVSTNYTLSGDGTLYPINNTFTHTIEETEQILCYTDIQLSDSVPPGATVEVLISHIGSNFTKISPVATFTEVGEPDLTGTTLTLSGLTDNTLNAFDTYSDDQVINLNLKGGIIDDYISTGWAQFKQDFSLKSVSFCFYRTSSGPDVTGVPGFVVEAAVGGIDGVNGLTLSVKKKDIFVWNTRTEQGVTTVSDYTHIRKWFNPFAGQYTVRGFIRFNSVFDNLYYNSNKNNKNGRADFKVNFDKAPNIVSHEFNFSRSLRGPWTTFDSSSHYLQEGEETGSIFYQNKVTLDFWPEDSLSFGYFSDLPFYPLNVSAGTISYPDYPEGYNPPWDILSGRRTIVSLGFYCKELTQNSYTCTFTVKNGGVAEVTPQTYPAIRHTKPNYKLNSCEISDPTNWTLDYNCTVTDYGISDNSATTIKYCICDSDGNQITPYITLSSQTPTLDTPINCDITDWSDKNLTIKLVTESSAMATRRKTFTTNFLNVFALEPTISYRKNSIGINTEEPASDAIVDINSNKADTVTKIYLRGKDPNTHNDVNWVIDIPNGTITYIASGVSHVLDLKTL